MKELNITDFLDKLDLKFKNIIGTPKFCNQKTQIDVVECVSLCILDFVKKKNSFSIKDIWFAKFSVDHVYETFRKPISTDKKSQKEFDKFFAHPIEFLTYFGVLNREKKSNKYHYTILNKTLLEYVANNQNNTLNFMNLCFKYFLLKNEELKIFFDNFFNLQNKDSFDQLKDEYGLFIKKNTQIKKDYEWRRMFTPFVNVLAFKNKKKGTEKGRLSSDLIHRDQLIYGRPNWSDIAKNKPRGITRSEWLLEYLEKQDEEKALTTTESYAKKCIKEKYGDISEYSNLKGASNTHHIFPRTSHFKLCGFKENLIRLTPNEHLLKAHPGNNTQRVDKTFQIELLKSKLNSIEKSLKKNEDFYDYNDFIFVLREGFAVDIPNNLNVSEIRDFLNSRSTL